MDNGRYKVTYFEDDEVKEFFTDSHGEAVDMAFSKSGKKNAFVYDTKTGETILHFKDSGEMTIFPDRE